MRKRLTWLKILEPLAVAACAALIVLAAVFEAGQTAMISIAAVVLAMVPFFARFERARPAAKDVVPIVVLVVLAVAGRAAFAFLPNVQPATAIIIVAGLVFGAQAGFLTGALGALLSNMALGQGPWTPWQMLAWGLIGYGAGLLARTRLFQKNAAVAVYGFAASFVFGWMMNVWHVLAFVQGAFWPGFAAACALSVYFDLTHAVSTAVFLTLMLVPWRKKLLRVKQKYGMMDGGGGVFNRRE